MLNTVFRVFAVLTVLSLPNSCFAQIYTFSGFPADSQANAAASSGAFGQPAFSFPAGNFAPASAASASASAASSSSSSIQAFVSKFTEAIDSNPLLRDAFDLSQTSPQAFSEFSYHNIHAHMMSRGVSDPSDVAKYATQHITQYPNALTYPMLVRINANAMGKHLLAEGILNDMNAASLASDFATEMENSAKRSVDKSFQQSKFQALADGYFGFLKRCHLDTGDKLAIAGRYFGDEYKLAAGYY